MMKVSCIVPIYNLESRMERGVESLLNQTLKDIEIILINDCSTDDTAKYMEKYSSYKNVITVHLDKNMRQGG